MEEITTISTKDLEKIRTDCRLIAFFAYGLKKVLIEELNGRQSKQVCEMTLNRICEIADNINGGLII